MKKLIYGGLLLALVGIIIFSCNKKDVAHINDENLNETDYFSTKSIIQDTVNLIFDQTEAEEISCIFKVFQNSLLDLTKNSIVVDVVRNILEDTMVNEKVYLKVLESRLSSHNLNPSVSFSINNNEDMNDIIGIQLGANNEKETVEVEESLARTKQIWVISLSDIDDSDLYPALPWQKCYCSRGGGTREDPNGDIVSNQKGSCDKNGECNGSCGRASIWGNCPRSTCPGC